MKSYYEVFKHPVSSDKCFTVPRVHQNQTMTSGGAESGLIVESGMERGILDGLPILVVTQASMENKSS